MAAMSSKMHQYVGAKVAKAAELLESAQRSIPTPPDYANFDRALRLLDECGEALASAWDVDTVAQVLRTASAELGQLCGGPAEASVNAAISLIDQAIGGETM